MINKAAKLHCQNCNGAGAFDEMYYEHSPECIGSKREHLDNCDPQVVQLLCSRCNGRGFTTVLEELSK